MDKPKNGNTITIKLNGDDQSFQEGTKKIEPESTKTSYPKVIKINSNLIDEETLSETAAAQESVDDESFDWIIPESSDQAKEEFTLANHKEPKKAGLPKIAAFSTKTKNKNGRSLASILLSAAFAILIGTTIGFVMLKLVITGPNEKTNTVTGPAVTEEETTPNHQPTAGKTTAGTISQFTAFAVQGGVFTSKEGAADTSAQLTARGLPNKIIEIDGKYFIYLGLADSIETAKSLSTEYKGEGAEGAFAKPLLLDEKKVSGITDKEKAFLEDVPAIYQTLSLATSTALLNSTIPDESTKALTVIEEQLNVSGIKNKDVENLKKELTYAQEKVKSFQKSKDVKNLSQAQQHLLNFISIFYSL